jgi:hypothetical protein
LKRLKLRAAGDDEITEQVDRVAVDHLTQLEQALVGRQIGVNDRSSIAPALLRTLGDDIHRIRPTSRKV